jgi:hypothetical protein
MEPEHEPAMNLCISNASLNKGLVREDKQLVAWDCIQDCVPERCPIGTRCTYKHHSDPKCAVQTEYLQTFVDTIFRTYRYMDEAEMYKIGMHLVPLYSQLCRLKIVELGVGAVTYEDLRGVTKIHPIFKEIRDTLRVISSLWRDIGFTGPNAPALPGDVFAGGREGFGDPGHYARISQDSDNKRNVIR